jgi:hypothetical protein
MTRHGLATLLATASAIASAAEPIEPCSLLSAADLAELGVPTDAVRSEQQQGGARYCNYRVPGTPTGVSSASVILSTAVPDRALQVHAMLNKALSEASPAQLAARGEYLTPSTTCKVVSVAQVESSQCLAATEQSVVGLTLVRTNGQNEISYPTLQLRFISKLLSSVAERGG